MVEYPLLVGMYQRNRVFLYIYLYRISRVEQYYSEKQLNDNCSSHTWNEEDDAFHQQLEKRGTEKVFSDKPEPFKRELRGYIEDWEKLLMKKNCQITCTHLLEKYGGLSLYDIYFEKIYSIDDDDIPIVKGYRYALIGNPYHPYGTSSDHEYFLIHDNLFNRS